jgi:hypothetical protein
MGNNKGEHNMESKKIIRALKNICERKIERLKRKVKDEDENTFINGNLMAYECILQTILNYEEMRDFSKDESEQSN